MADNCGLKFCRGLKEHWEQKGHEVRYERGASEYIAQWADLYYIDWWDNNIHYLYKLYHGDTSVSRPENWDNNRKPKIVVRAIDWEVWLGYVRDQKIIDWVDQVICIAPHIEKKLRMEANFGGGLEETMPKKLKLIRPGVDLDKFPLKTRQTDGFQIGMVLGDMWVFKNNIGGLNIFAMLAKQDPRWKLHIRGQHEPGEYYPVYYEHFLKSRNLEKRVTLDAEYLNMNDFYDKLDYLLHPGLKETFCYGVGEAMAKGIKPVINTFYGSEDIWDRKYRFYDYEEAVSMFNGEFNPLEYRNYIKEHYNADRMYQEFDELLGT